MGTYMRVRGVTVLLIILACWAGSPVLAQDAEAAAQPAAEVAAPGPVTIAKVQLGKIQGEYLELRSAQGDLDKWLQAQRAYLDELVGFAFLSAEHFDEAAAILQKGAEATDQEKKRLEELRGVSDAKDQRQRELLANAQRTPQEEDEFNSLREVYNARQKQLEDKGKRVVAELEGRRQRAVSGLMKKVQEAIQAEAQAQAFTYVLDADVVFFGGTDITDSVLSRLNAGQQPSQETGGGAQEGGG